MRADQNDYKLTEGLGEILNKICHFCWFFKILFLFILFNIFIKPLKNKNKMLLSKNNANDGEKRKQNEFKK